MDSYTEGLRCQDVNSGLRTFDATGRANSKVVRSDIARGLFSWTV
jgi:hypothetical protein